LGNILLSDLLETATLYPKKKYYKRILEYILETENPADLEPKVIDKIVDVGILGGYPILLGNTLEAMVDKGYKVSKTAGAKYVSYLESLNAHNDANFYE